MKKGEDQEGLHLEYFPYMIVQKYFFFLFLNQMTMIAEKLSYLTSKIGGLLKEYKPIWFLCRLCKGVKSEPVLKTLDF